MQWSPEQVLSFAPDAPTARRSKGLANKQNWNKLSINDNTLWGECQSSGSGFYKTQIDLNGPVFKCNCPSRKYPCKHSLALLLTYINTPSSFQNTPPPLWVAEWLEKRVAKPPLTGDLKVDKPDSKAVTLQSKNREKRLELMSSGLEDLELWIMDLIRHGLANTEGQAYSFWQSISSRMVDSKLGGIGKKILRLPLLHGTNADWPQLMLAELSQFYLTIKGFKNLHILPPQLQADLLSFAGVVTKKDGLLPLKGIKDTWKVMGNITGVEDNLNFRRSWLYGLQTNNIALILEYSFGEAEFAAPLFFGKSLDGELVYFPSNYPMRAIIKENYQNIYLSDHPNGFRYLESFFEAYALAIKDNPWTFHFPALLENLVPLIENEQLILVDQQNKQNQCISKSKQCLEIDSYKRRKSNHYIWRMDR